MTIKGRVFLLDDDELISSMLARSLRKEGYEVQSETTTDDIMDKISAWCPDLVLLDINLDEEKTGLDILEDMKREAIPSEVVMLTADASAESAITAMKLGAADYLTKPFNMAEVQLVIRKTIEKERPVTPSDIIRWAVEDYLEYFEPATFAPDGEDTEPAGGDDHDDFLAMRHQERS